MGIRDYLALRKARRQLKDLHTHARGLHHMRRDIMPAVSSYLRELSETATAIHAVSVTADCSYEESIIPEMSALLGDERNRGHQQTSIIKTKAGY